MNEGLTYKEMVTFYDLKKKANSTQLSYMIDGLKREEQERNERIKKEFDEAMKTGRYV